MQGYGATECGVVSATNQRDHGLGTVGRTIKPVKVKLADDGEILVSGPTLFHGYWRDPATTAASLSPDGWYRTGDIGRHDEAGHLILMGRKKDIIVLPNGLNVYPEDIENALRTAGIRDAVVVETVPGRIEAVVLAPGESGAAPRRREGRVDPASGDRRPGPRSKRDRGRRTSGEQVPLGPSARRRLAALARRGLPQNPYAQGSARPSPSVGGHRRATSGPRGGRHVDGEEEGSMKRKLALLAAVVVVVAAAGAFMSVHYWSRAICWAGHAPDRISMGYEQLDTVTAGLADLPQIDSWRTNPPVVLDLPTIGACPGVDTSRYQPMVIWVRVGENQFVRYERGGGP